MREIFSVRFFIAIGAVAGLLFLLFTFFVARDVVDEAIFVGLAHTDDVLEQIAEAAQRAAKVAVNAG